MPGIDKYTKFLLRYDIATKKYKDIIGIGEGSSYLDTGIYSISHNVKFFEYAGDIPSYYYVTEYRPEYTLGNKDFTIDWWGIYKRTDKEIGGCYMKEYLPDDTKNKITNLYFSYLDGAYANEKGVFIDRNENNSAELIYMRNNYTNDYVYNILTSKPMNRVFDQYIHRAIVRHNNYIYSYNNGKLVYKYQIGNVNLTPRMLPMRISINMPYHKMDEVRISIGIARWTNEFIPPTEPYSKDIHRIINESDQMYCRK